MNNLFFPPNAQWEMTGDCNHNCIHCYNYWRKDESHNCFANANSEEYYLKIATKLVSLKPVSVVITGGEPLLVFDKIKSSMDLLLKNGIFVSINTNAVLLNSDMLEYIKSRRMGLFISFPCSNKEICDKITNRKNSFERICEKLDAISKYGIPFSTNMVVSKLNIDYVEETALFLKKRYNISKMSITRVGKPINSDDSFNSLMLDFADIQNLQETSVKLSNEYNIKIETSCPYTACSIYSKEAFELFAYSKICTAGKTSYAIDTEGNVKACPRDSNIYGNILRDSFTGIWESMSSWRDGTYLPNECKKCKVVNRCLGGCRVDSYPFDGRLDKLDRISNISNLPIKFEKAPSIKEYNFTNSHTFKLKDTLKFITENGCTRISVGRNYMYITPEMSSFFDSVCSSSLKSFSFYDLKKHFDFDNITANKVVAVLLANNFII